MSFVSVDLVPLAAAELFVPVLDNPGRVVKHALS